MKRNKLLFATTTLLTIPAIFSTVSCGKTQTTAELVAHAIFDPCDLAPHTIQNLDEEISKLTQEELNNELIYDLFGDANLTKEDLDNKSLHNLYDEGIVGLKVSITRCEGYYENDVPHGDFLGYVSFVFLKDFNDAFKVNDYIMYVYEIKDIEIDGQIETTIRVVYDYNKPGGILGNKKIRQYGGQKEHLEYIQRINTSKFAAQGLPTTSKNGLIQG